MVKIDKTYNLSEDWIDREVTGLLSDTVNGIEIFLHDARRKTSELDNDWKTLSNQQLHDLLTSLNVNAASYSEHNSDDIKLITITLDDYVVNFLEACTMICKFAPEHSRWNCTPDLTDCTPKLGKLGGTK